MGSDPDFDFDRGRRARGGGARALRSQIQGLTPVLLLLPAGVAFVGLFCYPMLLTLVLSLRPEGAETGWTLAHYVTFLGDSDGRAVVLLTFGLALNTTLLSVLLSVPVALALRRRLAGHRWFRLVVLVPLVVPGLIGALGLLIFWGPRGWFNLLLTQALPVLPRPLAVTYTLPGLVLFYVWLYFPYTCVTTLAALEGLDPAIEEAAEVAGAGRWQRLRHVLLPLATPGILAGSVLTFMAAFGAFSVPLVAGGNYRPLAVSIYKEIAVPIPPHWSGASAIAVVMGVVQVAFLALYMRAVRRLGGRR
jgi:putative spermidine/putrescine transport system permease protein